MIQYLRDRGAIEVDQAARCWASESLRDMVKRGIAHGHISEEQSNIAVKHAAHKNTRCAHCKREARTKKNHEGTRSRVLKCVGCENVFNCDADCRDVHRPIHEPICTEMLTYSRAHVR